MHEENPREHLIQATIVGWFNRNHPTLKGRLFSIPNGSYLQGDERQRAQQMNKLKAEGLSIGAPDLMLPLPSGEYHGLFLEIKRKTGSKTSQEQKDWNAYLNAAGYKAIICKGLDDAIATINEYIKEI